VGPAGGAESVGGADAQRAHSAQPELAADPHEPHRNVFVAGARPEPTDNEIAQALEDSVENVRTARRMTAAELSLDAPVDRTDKDAATLGERFAGQEGGEIEERTDGKLMREFIDRIFQKYLTPRERKILYLYYGLEEGSEAMTLEKIGALMGVTRERIRQIRERAFEKLRESPDGKASRDSGERPRTSKG